MHILTEDGKIVEGQPLSAEEFSILNQIKNTDQFGNYPTRVYLSHSERTAVIQFLFENFYLTRRDPLPDVEPVPTPEPEAVPAPEADNV